MKAVSGPLYSSSTRDHQVHTRWYATGLAVVALIVFLRLLLHLLTANRYGIFRDEMYYIACGRHLDWGYVDMPPFIPLMTRLFTAISGLPSSSSGSYRRSRDVGQSRSQATRLIS